MSTPSARRIEIADHAPRAFTALLRLEKAIDLDEGLRGLVRMRASQMNGCAFCIDMPWKEARAGGESEERLYMLDAWRESALYSARERAALELCEAMTLVAGDHVPDAAWERAAAALHPDELAGVMFATVAINAWNRLMIASRAEPGHAVPEAARAA
jgi:AhpD family alkylhydroperoxidase